MKRHKWDKTIYRGKFSSFEMEATCVNCGCRREKLFMGYKYTLNGQLFETAPPCDSSLKPTEI
jgi:hypothetical protein